ncbi:MAG: glycosyltransferase family 4 protein [Planctomycetaceae bacterium]|nr:glycosyltransferase family 4 protein [Planctomycetaceae bacterium]
MAAIAPRVLLLAGRFSLRGTSAYTLRLAEKLPPYGFRVEVVCPNSSRVSPERRRSLGILEYPYLQTPVWSSVVLRLLRRELAKDPPGLIHVQSRNALPQGIWLARRLRRPYIVTLHDVVTNRASLPYDRKWCERVIVVSEAVRQNVLRESRIPADRVTTIPSGVNCDHIRDVIPPLSAGHRPVIGTAGPLEAVKGFPFFLGAAARLLEAGRDVEFLIAGAGPEEQNLRRLATELGIDERVTFAPNLFDFSEAIAAMDVFVLPSLQQGLGTIMLEAMALGRPVIATRVGGVYQVVTDNETGLLVPPSDSVRLAERIAELLDNPKFAQRIGAAACWKVELEYSVDKMIEETTAVYNQVLGSLEAPPAVPVVPLQRVGG